MGSLLICVSIFLLYSAAFGHNFLFDEESIILKNPLIRDLSQVIEIFKQPYFYEGLPDISWNQYYRPLTTLTFALDYHFWNVNPLGFNLTNTLLHCGVCVLLFKLLSMMFEEPLAAFLPALLYCVHTIHTEAVTYIASRGDVLGTLLVLLALFFYWRSRFGWALLAHAMAFFAKESAILTVAYILLLDIAFVKSDWKGLLKKTSPFILLTLLFILFRKFVCPVPLGPVSLNIKEAALRVLSMGPPFLTYLQTLLIPEVFTFSLTVDFAKSFLEPKIFLSLFIVFLMLVGWYFALRRRGAAFFGISVFLISFLPYLEIVHFYPEWAEHYLYVPAIGLTVLLADLLKHILKGKSKAIWVFFLILYIPLVAFFSYRTWERNKIYNDTETYFEYLSKSGARYAYFGYQNMGRILIENGELDQAIVSLKTAEAIEPHSDVTENLLGIYYLKKEKLQESLNHFNLATTYGGTNQVYRINASYVLMRMKKYKEVIEILEEVQKITPEYSSVYINLLAANELLGHVAQAKKWGEEGLLMTQRNEWEHVALLMAMIHLAYRQGWDEATRSYLSDISEKHSRVFWCSDVARMILGKITVETFIGFNQTRYLNFENMMHYYVLMAYVMQGRWGEAEKYLEKNKASFERQAAKQPLLRKEIDRASEGIRLSKGVMAV